MFLARSAFWLSAAFIIIAPSAGVDMSEAARATGVQLVRQGAEAVSDTFLPESCGSIECHVGRSMLTQVAAAPTEVEVALAPAAPALEPTDRLAFPPPRPDWAY